jgi:hypothetical protein
MYVKSVRLFDPLVHHLGERRPAFRRQSRFAGVGELPDEFNTILFGPFADLIPLDRNRVFLSVFAPSPQPSPP